MTQIHTPTPYICASGPSMHGWPIVNSQGQMIAQLPMIPTGFPNKEVIDKRIAATGKFIERACNAHDDLIEALKKARHVYFTHGVNPAEIDALLERVEGE